MPTILQINTVVNSGSTGRIAEGIGEICIQQGWISYIGFGRNDNESSSKKIRVGNNFDIKWHGVETRLFDRHGLASKNATKKFIEVIQDINPDIIHLHNLHGYYLNIEILFNYLAKINKPVVWTLHDCWAITGHCTHFSFIGCEKWKSQCGNCPQKKEYPASYIIDNSYYNYNKKKELITSVNKIVIVGVSRWLIDKVENSFLYKYSNRVIYNGIDLKKFKPFENCEDVKEKYAIPKEKFIMLGVASVWSDRKGLSDFMKLSHKLLNDEIIVLVGIKKRIINKLPSNIIGIERTENVEELAKLYSLSDVLLNLTKEDSYPTINLEAIACGTPVITYKTGGSPESINTSTGFVVERENIEELYEKIKLLKSNTKKIYTDKCRKIAISNFNQNDRFKEYIDLYEELLQREC